MCSKVNVGCQIKESFQGVVQDGFDELSRKVGESALASLHALSTFWVKIDSPTLATQHGDRWEDSRTVGFLHQHVLTVSAAVFTVAILVAGIRIAWEQRAEPLQQLLKATMLFILVSGAGTATVQLLAGWSDEFALDLVKNSLPPRTSFDAAIGNLVLNGALSNTTAQSLPLMIALFASVSVFIASAIQVVLLLIRSAMLVLLAGTFPLAAAATNTEIGKAWFKKYCGWALAFIAYKPAAALIYAAAFRMSAEGMSGRSGNDMVQVLTGLMMLMLAIFALPALLRFAVPVTAAVAGGSSAMGSAVADPGGIASGAINVGRGALGSRSGGGSGGGSSGGGGGGGSSASGAVGVAAGAASGGLAAAGAALSATKKASGALAGAAAHSAGEAGGGSSGSSSSSRPAWGGGGRRNSSSKSQSSSTPPIPQPVGPSGSS
jgi:hypothetical protein